jgi:hypothetical protein
LGEFGETMNLYERFINHLKRKEKAVVRFKLKHQRHRIIPRHDGGTYTPANVVLCTLKDHIKAHSIRYEVYGQTGDLFAFSIMTGRVKAGGELVVPTLGALATHKVCKEKKTGFWSSETQRANALKGNTPEVRKKKSEGGKRGNQIIREKGVGVYAKGQAAKSGRASALRSRWGYTVPKLYNLKFDPEQRLSLSETFFDYYVMYGLNGNTEPSS